MSSQTPKPVTCTRRIEFDAAHRVMGHEGKCKNLHGHRYAIEASFAAKQLDTLGRVVDFGIIKEVLGRWVDENWDHTTILYDKDQALGKAITTETGQKIFYLSSNPTAENMADYILHDVCSRLFAPYPVTCIGIRLYETPNCYAEALI
jgi:6-pyruvoyltetrahydropterin/6-carboxytetrahydropterin synthase